MRWIAAIALVVGLAGLAFSDERRAPGVRQARSVGSPQDGRLLHGRRLRETPFIEILPHAAPRGRRFGTEELVGVLTRAAGAVADKHPGSTLRVADLSARGGGDVHMHASHESGRDADVAFYLRDAGGADARPPRFVKMIVGRSADGSLVFDAARNWTFVEALVADRRTTVTHVFVAEHLKALLVAEARAAGARPGRIERAEAILTQPRGAFPHDNHFHIRVACAPEDRPECVDGTRRSRRR
ncbi:MAG: penicillin-insensitive murein endopeptidase [Deltaproteobacteria bacterium]|nr:penicillin-insensitive murein endopeptidase [Deltaproteobacteria bacterium]